MALPPLDLDVLRRIVGAAPGPDIVAAIASVRDSAGQWLGSAGVADLENRQPVDAAGRFRIGSVTKTFTATLVLQLVAEGMLRLDEPVEQQLPGVLPADVPPITVRQLLQHTSGIPDYEAAVGLQDPSAVLRDRLRTWIPTELVALSACEGLAFAPGTSQLYSSANYLLLGMLIEAVTGRSYPDAIDRGILGPLNLHDTSLPGTNPQIHGRHAHGYTTIIRKGQPALIDITEWNPSVAGAAGEIISTVQNLDSFLAALLGGHLLPRSLEEEMLRSFEGGLIAPGAGYGLGVIILELPCGVTVYGHSGGLPGYLTAAFATRNGDRRLVASLTTNFYGGLPVPAMFELLLGTFCGQLQD